MIGTEHMHVYKRELSNDDPIALKPEKISVPMKPHQLAALHKAIRMERGEAIEYNTFLDGNENGNAKVTTNVGVIGDIVGYGKTLTALSIVAASSPNNIHYRTEHTYAYHGRYIGHLAVTCNKPTVTVITDFVHTTLAIVPRGPVYMQWKNAIETQTSLRVLAIDSLTTIRQLCPPSECNMATLKAFFEQYDIILLKNTNLKTLTQYYSNAYSQGTWAWDRILIDEAHDIIKSVPLFCYKFLWLITATYLDIPRHVVYSGRNFLASTVREIVTDITMKYILVKSRDDFVKESFVVPEYIEHTYVCAVPQNIHIVQPFLSANALERVNANDIAGAIRELGGTNETEANIVDLVTKDIQKDIRNKELEHQYILHLEIHQDSKENKMKSIQEDIARLKERLQSLIDRVSMLSSKTCPICYDSYDHPIILPCMHIFCGKCFLSWGKTCPECRSKVSGKDIIAVVEESEAVKTTMKPQPIKLLSKSEKLLELVKSKPDGKFLVFSKYDSSFTEITRSFNVAGILYAELKGSTAIMMRTLEQFNSGHIKVILLNTHHAGSGINISTATDVVLFHKMYDDKTQAIGRAQRVGRETPLIVHNLCHPNEV